MTSGDGEPGAQKRRNDSHDPARLGADVAYAAAILVLAAGCHGKPRSPGKRTPAAAFADAQAPDANASELVPAELAVNGPVWRFVSEWSAAIDRHDVDALQRMYADRVSFYGARRSRADVIHAKKSAFEAEPDFHQMVPGFIDIARGIGDYYVARFWKLSGRAARLAGTNAKLVVGHGDGGPMLILEEGENEVSGMKNSACDLAAADVVNALPAVKRSVAQMSARADASNGTLRFGSIGPQDFSDPEGFFVSVGLHSDERFETLMSYNVNREGFLSIDIASEGPVVIPRAALRKVAQACRR